MHRLGSSIAPSADPTAKLSDIRQRGFSLLGPAHTVQNKHCWGLQKNGIQGVRGVVSSDAPLAS